jgi:hypothetical protein
LAETTADAAMYAAIPARPAEAVLPDREAVLPDRHAVT